MTSMVFQACASSKIPGSADSTSTSAEEVPDLSDDEVEQAEAFVYSLQGHPGLVSISDRFPKYAVIIIEPNYVDDLAFHDPPRGVEVRPAALSAPERERAHREVEKVASEVVGEAYKSVSYDVVTNRYTIFVDPDSLTQIGAALPKISSGLEINSDADIGLSPDVMPEVTLPPDGSIEFEPGMTSAPPTTDMEP